MTPHPTREAIADVLALCEKATAGQMQAIECSGLHGYEAFLMADAGALGYVPKDSEPQSGCLFRKDDAAAIAAAVNFLRAHGPALLAMAADAGRWNAWCERHPLLTYRKLTGDTISGAPYQPDKLNAAMDDVIAAGTWSSQPDAISRAIDTARQGAARGEGVGS